MDLRALAGSGANQGAQLVNPRIHNASSAPVTPGAGNMGQIWYDTTSGTTVTATTSNGRLKFSDGTNWTAIVTSVRVANQTVAVSAQAVGANNTVNGLGQVTLGSNPYDITLTMLTADGSNAGAMTAAHYTLLANKTENSTASTLVYRSSGNSFAVGKITGLADLTGSDTGDTAANKNYVDNVAAGLSVHASCRVRTTGNLNLSAPGASVDGVAMGVGDRMLCDRQTTTTQDGIYVWNGAAVPATRAADYPIGMDAAGTFVFIEQGTDADKGFVCVTDKPNDIVGTHDLSFSQFSGAGTYSAGNGMVLSSNAFHFCKATNYTTGDIFYANGATSVAALADVATGSALISGGIGVAPSWGKIALTTHISGILPLANGGTNKDNSGAATGGIAYKTATDISVTAALTGILTGNGASAPTAATGTKYGVPYWATTSTLGTTAAPASNYVTLHGNTSGAPTWSLINLTTDVTGTLPVGNGGTGTSTTFTQGSVIFAGPSGVYAQDNANFFWNDSTNCLGLRYNTPLDTLTIGSGGWMILNGGAIQSNSEVFGGWQATYPSTWNRGIGWYGSGGTLGCIVGGSGNNDTFSSIYIGPSAALAWVKVTSAGQLQVTTTGASAGIVIGGDWELYRSAANVATAGQINIDLSSVADSGFRANSTNVAGQIAFTHYNLAADANSIWRVRRDTSVRAIMEFGAGGATAVDTNLYRSSANTLRTDGYMIVGTFATGTTNTVIVSEATGFGTRTINSGVWTGSTLVTGTGTINKLTRWSTTTGALVDANITDNGTDITVAPAGASGNLVITPGGTAGCVSITRAAAGNPNFKLFVSGDTNPRLQIEADGTLAWGPGNAAVDVTFKRSGAAAATLTGALTISSTLTVNSVSIGATNNVLTQASAGSGIVQYRVADSRIWGSNLVDGGGTLTATYIPKATGANTLANSLLTDNGTVVTDTGNFQVNGTTTLGDAATDTTTIRGLVTLTDSSVTYTLRLGADCDIYRYAANICGTAAGDIWRASAAASTTIAADFMVTGDTVSRLTIKAGGDMNWGPGGAGATDTTLARSGVGTLTLTGSLSISSNLTMTTQPNNLTNSVATWSASSSGNLGYRTIDTRVWGTSLVDGTGTANKLSKWSDTDTLTNSQITDDGTNVSVVTASNGNFTVLPNGTGKIGLLTASPTSSGVDIAGQVRIQGANYLQFGGTGAADYDVSLSRTAANTLTLTGIGRVTSKIIVNASTFNSTGVIETAGHISPNADNTYDLGETSWRWRNIRGVNIYGTVTPTGFTQGSVIFAGTGGILAQDNSNFFFDATNFTLKIAGGQSTQKTAISLDTPARAVAGINDSHFLEMTARTYDTVPHYGTCRFYANGLSNAGSVAFRFETGVDATPNNPQFGIVHTASTVNFLRATGAPTGSYYGRILATGTDTDIGINFLPQGSSFTSSGDNHSVHDPRGRVTWTDASATKPTCSLMRAVVVNLNGTDKDRNNTVPTLGTNITITHNLNNSNVLAFLILISTGAVELCDITQTTANSVTLGFTTAPSSGNYRVVLIG